MSGYANLAEALQRLAADRDETAWAYVVEQSGQSMYQTCFAILRQRDAAEEALQEALLVVRDRAKGFRGASDDDSTHSEAVARAWLRRVAGSCALNLLPSRTRRERHESQAPIFQHEPRPADEQVAADEIGGLVRQELAAMPERYRLPILLYYFADLGYEEIAHELGCSVGNARVRLHRCLNRLQRRLRRVGLVCSLGVITRNLDAALPSAEASVAVLAPLDLLSNTNNSLLLSSGQASAASLAVVPGGMSMMNLTLAVSA